jgi:putative transposase
MRRARIKIAAEEGEAVYHCVTRVVNGERLLDETAREVLRQQLWQISDFCGVEVLTYTVLSNHFHVLLRVPLRPVVTDQELLRRYRVLYPFPTAYQTARLEVVEAQLKAGGAEAVAWRQRNLSLMYDISQFMKLLKQRFTIWFNHAHARYGTLWAERFKSVLVEPEHQVVQTIAAYIDLNAVRAGLVEDPKDYRFCGYAEAIAGKSRARAGLRSVVGGRRWLESQAAYRQILYGTGSGSRDEAAVIPREAVEQVLVEGGRLPLAVVLRCRWRYFTDGAVLGGKAFVSTQRARFRSGQRERVPEVLPAFGDWGGLTTLHRLRGPATT